MICHCQQDDARKLVIYFQMNFSVFLYYVVFSCKLIYVLFVSSVIPYRAVIIPIKKLSNTMTTSNPWLCVSGELGDSGILQITKNVLEMTFDVSAVMSRSSCSALKLIQQFILSVFHSLFSCGTETIIHPLIRRIECACRSFEHLLH